MQYASYHSRLGCFSRDLMCLMIAASCTPSGSATPLSIHRWLTVSHSSTNRPEHTSLKVMRRSTNMFGCVRRSSWYCGMTAPGLA